MLTSSALGDRCGQSDAKVFEQVNREAYGLFSHQYNRIAVTEEDVKLQRRMLGYLAIYLIDTFGWGEHKVLDVGCGVGFNLERLREVGVILSGVDFSKEMLRYAGQRNPFTLIYHSNFMDFEPEQQFEGIAMEAFIHLFPKGHVPEVFDKVRELLVPGGIGTLTTTESERSYEGYFTKEKPYPQQPRFRKFWQLDELVGATESAGFKVLEVLRYNNFDKDWMRLIFQHE